MPVTVPPAPPATLPLAREAVADAAQSAASRENDCVASDGSIDPACAEMKNVASKLERFPLKFCTVCASNQNR